MGSEYQNVKKKSPKKTALINQPRATKENKMIVSVKDKLHILPSKAHVFETNLTSMRTLEDGEDVDEQPNLNIKGNHNGKIIA